MNRRNKIWDLLVILWIVAIIFVGCASTQTQQATKTMLVMQTGIVDVATTADQLCSAGLLSQPQCDEVSIAYDKAKVHYDLAESTLATAIKAGDNESSWENYRIIHENFQRIYGDLLAVAFKYGITPEVQ